MRHVQLTTSSRSIAALLAGACLCGNVARAEIPGPALPLTDDTSRVSDTPALPAAWAQARQRERAGDPAGAAAVLTRAAETDGVLGTDYAVELQLGWLWFEAGDTRQASEHYRTASRISGGAIDPRVGLAYCAAREGRMDDAEGGFRAVLADAPDHAPARSGLAIVLSAPRAALLVQAGTTGQLYGGSPTLDSGIGGSVSLAARTESGFALSTTYRYDALQERGNARDPDGEPFSHHTFFLSAGYASTGALSLMDGRSGFDARLHYGLLSDASRLQPISHALGATVDTSLPLGLLHLESSVLLRGQDGNVLRLGAAWRTPLGAGVYLKPGVAMQVVGGEVFGSASVTAEYWRGEFGLWASGKFGRERSPVLLDAALVYDSASDILYGASAGTALPLSDGLSLNLGYEWAHYTLDVDGESVASDGHFLTLGLSFGAAFGARDETDGSDVDGLSNSPRLPASIGSDAAVAP
ncbi:MAG: tetratricopeptide repeat protein [Myxococcales bacterium]|nr:tetratricopeptide repeat protein [Myxococcales bacterium]